MELAERKLVKLIINIADTAASLAVQQQIVTEHWLLYEELAELITVVSANVFGRHAQPKALWDWQWVADNYATNNNCLQHRKMDKYRGKTFSVGFWIYGFIYNVSKKSSWRLDYGAFRKRYNHTAAPCWNSTMSHAKCPRDPPSV